MNYVSWYMKKLFILASLVLYMFGASYLVHASTMVLPYMQNVDNVMVDDFDSCANDVTESEKENKTTCLDKCIGDYWELSSNYRILIKDIETVKINSLELSLTQPKEEVSYLIKNNSPPNISWFPYKWYIGQITVLLI